MKSEQFEEVIDYILIKCRNLLNSKANEYATEDRLHNFKIAAALQGVDPKQALAGMMAKHTVSVYDMCMSGDIYTSSLWDEKICDSINYLLLLRALIAEKDWSLEGNDIDEKGTETDILFEQGNRNVAKRT